MRPVEGTILTVVREAAEAAEAASSAGGDLIAVLDAAREQGADALARTPDMLPVLKEAGVVDAGGPGFLLLLDVLLHLAAGRPVPEPVDVHRPSFLDPLPHHGQGHTTPPCPPTAMSFLKPPHEPPPTLTAPSA